MKGVRGLTGNGRGVQRHYILSYLGKIDIQNQGRGGLHVGKESLALSFLVGREYRVLFL